MKGIIFSELVRWTEEVYSHAIADAMIGRSAVPNDGAYTSVGTYPHQEALALLVALSQLTGHPVNKLARSYGRWLAGRFCTLYSELVRKYPDARSLLRHVETHIHAEVRKIYPESQPPSVLATQDDQGLRIDYASHRPFADVAHGLIEGFVEHYGENLCVTRSQDNPEATTATFWLR